MKPLILLFAVLATLSAGKKSDKAVPLDPRHVEVDVRYMEPLRWSPRSVSYGYSLTIVGDSVYVHLPYMGVVHQHDMENDGLNFEKPLQAMQVTRGKKGRAILSFSCRKGFIDYYFKLTLYPNGKAYLRLMPSNADAVSYDGEWH